MINSRKAIWAHNLHSFHTGASSGGACFYVHAVRFTWVGPFVAGPQLSPSLRRGLGILKSFFFFKWQSISSTFTWEVTCVVKQLFGFLIVRTNTEQIWYVQTYLGPHKPINNDYTCTDRAEGICSISSCTGLQRHPSHTEKGGSPPPRHSSSY